ncbi:MAG: mandelate racemase/muconate lactonizing enzyme family protein [Rhodospirillaceae bacterium]|jgi:L-alanine-DL-glutamate epimerase-like enolase superfamily enzyme|nr:mandelate racemase/muconate lactonizing enzyme family protein [Rhodospirillaceae bacterium]
MKITSIRTEVVYGRRKRAHGRVAATALGPSDVSEHALVFMETDAGIEGIGEISSVFSRRGRLLARDVDEVLAPALIGFDPFDITRINAAMDRILWSTELAKAGVEMAVWDILGKALDVPVYKLLGGKVRESIPLSYSIPFGEPEEMAEFAVKRAKEGFRTVKVKVGQSADRDVAAVKLVREAVGSAHRVRVDANMAWRTAKEAIAIIRRMEQYEPELIEQPLPPRELDALAEIRRNIGVPLMVDESVWHPRDAMEVIRREAADIVNVYVTESGGIQNAVKIFTLCEQAGLPCMIGSMPEFGVGTAAQIHLGTAMANLGPDSDTCGSLYHEADLLKTPLRFEKGHAYAPEGPGLGVELDMAVVERWRTPPGDTG